MLYGSTHLATNFGHDSWKVKTLRLLLFFIPRANPDNEKLYPLVKKWCLEIDDAGAPTREIGLNVRDEPLFAAPDEHNFGFWTDSSEAFDKNQLEPISADEFQRLWLEAQAARKQKHES